MWLLRPAESRDPRKFIADGTSFCINFLCMSEVLPRCKIIISKQVDGYSMKYPGLTLVLHCFQHTGNTDKHRGSCSCQRSSNKVSIRSGLCAECCFASSVVKNSSYRWGRTHWARADSASSSIPRSLIQERVLTSAVVDCHWRASANASDAAVWAIRRFCFARRHCDGWPCLIVSQSVAMTSLRCLREPTVGWSEMLKSLTRSCS